MTLASLIVVPLSVHAGVFDTIRSFLYSAEAEEPSEEPVTPTSEVKLLSSRINSDATASQGGGDVIVDDGALVSSYMSDVKNSDGQFSSGEISVYVVREGDSLSQIAEMFDVTTNTILWANDIEKASNIQPGDSLVILPIVGVRHVVKSGDTIASIAKKYQGDTEEILSYNQLSSASEIGVGDTLIIPGGNIHTAPPKRVAQVSAAGPASRQVQSSDFSHPLPGAVRTQGIHGYNAVDLASPVGTPVRAAGSGEVIISKASGWNGGYGNYIVIKHANGAQTLYSHLSSNSVGVGAWVSAGEVIGHVGSTGRSTGAHLHFEVRGAYNPF